MSRDQVRLVLFDLGGVLVELAGLPTPLMRLADSLSPDEIWARWLASPAVKAFETGRVEAGTFAVRLIEEMGLTMDPGELLQELASWPKGLFPGVLELVQSIPPEYERAILSNCNALHWPRLMEDTGLSKVFRLHFASHLTGKIKPDREAFEQVFAATGYAPREVLFLDDNRLNVEAGAGLGMNAVLVRGVVEARNALMRAGVLAPHEEEG